jgi:hypothetical protein
MTSPVELRVELFSGNAEHRQDRPVRKDGPWRGGAAHRLKA